MAQQVNVSFVDDMDGSEAQGTISFGLDGKSFEIDLSEANASRLRDAFAPYLTAARRVGGTHRVSRTGSKSTTSPADHERNQAIREWAQAQGLKVANRGRLSTEVVEAYNSKDAKPAAVEAAVVEAPVKKVRKSRARGLT